eukprot:5258346-Amphidinium_carterae.1
MGGVLNAGPEFETLWQLFQYFDADVTGHHTHAHHQLPLVARGAQIIQWGHRADHRMSPMLSSSQAFPFPDCCG